jgi:hypothetical protein
MSVDLNNPPVYETLAVAGAILAGFNVVEKLSREILVKSVTFGLGVVLLAFGLYGLVTS